MFFMITFMAQMQAQIKTQHHPFNIRTLFREKKAESGVEVLPTFFDYVEVKNAYKIGDVPKDKVLRIFNTLAFEIKEMFNLIYSNTDTEEEREILYALIEDLQRV